VLACVPTTLNTGTRALISWMALVVDRRAHHHMARIGLMTFAYNSVKCRQGFAPNGEP
jgi:hypothetical protein